MDKMDAAVLLMRTSQAEKEDRLTAAEYVFAHSKDGSDEKLEAANEIAGDILDALKYIFEHGDD